MMLASLLFCFFRNFRFGVRWLDTALLFGRLDGRGVAPEKSKEQKCKKARRRAGAEEKRCRATALQSEKSEKQKFKTTAWLAASCFTGIVVIVAAASAWAGQAGGAGPESIELTPEAERAITSALDKLAREQRPNGSWSDSTAETALVGLAMMVTGEIPGRGKYATNSSRALQYVLNNVQENGLIIGTNHRSPMYHHGLATLYLTQAWGLTGYESIKPKLKKAIDLIITTQSAKGGWRYFPVPNDEDISVTVMQVVALRAARNGGIDVPDKTIERAIEYVRGLAHRDGGFGYQTPDDRGIARTGAGMFSLQVCGQYDDPRIKQGLDYLAQRGLFDDRWLHYGVYYISASLYQIGGAAWDKNYPEIRDRLIQMQRNDSWGEVDKTAMAILALAIPYRFLPIYQR